VVHSRVVEPPRTAQKPQLAGPAPKPATTPDVPKPLPITDDLSPQRLAMRDRPFTALVTGGGGFLGRAIVDRLRARGVMVRNYSRGVYPELAKLGVAIYRGDLSDASALKRACEGCDMVFHVAALAGVWGPYEEYHRVNVAGTQNVVEACQAAGVQRLVFTSSPSVVFDGNDMEGIDESAPYPERFHAAYPKSKALAEQIVRAANGPRLATACLRPHLIWGPRDPHLLPRILMRARRLRQIGGTNKRVDSVYVDNAADAHLLAAGRLRPDSPVAGKVYFITNGEPRGMWDLINGILAAGDLPPVTRSVPRGMALGTAACLEAFYGLFGIDGEPSLTRFVARELSSAHWFDIRAARRDLAYEPKVSIDDGLLRLRHWLHGSGAALLSALGQGRAAGKPIPSGEHEAKIVPRVASR
jgi:nucleoside-diphosphate-sugar epimerase